MEKIRQPIVTVLGHVDHGKTSLLDRIRGSAVAKGESGGITQHIGASEIPISTIKEMCGGLLQKMRIELTIPGLLFIDTPGHSAFTTLRKRGGAISDLAVLVVDINEGMQPQTIESVKILKDFKTPFVVACTKIDRIIGWNPQPNQPFLKSLKEQSERSAQEIENRVYTIIGQLGANGLDSERYDRISDFSKQISIVPVSAHTGEGVPDLLVMLAGLAQRYLKGRIKFTEGIGKGTILEVKEQKGLGVTLDVILYDGEISKGDTLVIGGKKIIVAKVRALLKPEPLKELRTERQFLHMDSVVAASGIKISAPGIEEAIAGSPIRAVKKDADVEKAKEELKEETESVEIATDRDGVIMKADTLGGLEAMINIFMSMEIPIRKAEVGSVSKQDVLEIKTMKEPLVFAFNVKVSDEAAEMAAASDVKIFSSDVIYRLVDSYQEYKKKLQEMKEGEILDKVTRPGKVRIVPGFVFRQSKPAIFGVDVLAGTIKPKYRLKKNGKIVGEIKEVQKSGGNVDEAISGDRVAISMEDVTVGKHIFEGDVLETNVRPNDLRLLEKVKKKLRDDEKALLDEIANKEQGE